MNRKRSPEVSRYSMDHGREATRSRRQSIPTASVYSTPARRLERGQSDPDQKQSSSSRKPEKVEETSRTRSTTEAKKTSQVETKKSATETKKSTDTKETKKPFFSNEDLTQMGILSYELQDDKVRDICRTAIGLYSNKSGSMNNPKAISDLKKHIVQYEQKLDVMEAEYKAAKIEQERVERETELVHEKRKIVSEQLLTLFGVLEKARAKRKERMEMENLASVVNEKKSQKCLQGEMEAEEKRLKEYLSQQSELESNKKLRYETMIKLSSDILELEMELKSDAAANIGK